MSLSRRRTFAKVLSTLLVSLLTTSPAFAFKQGIHQSITESRLQSKGFTSDSAEVVGDANWYTDIYEQTSTAAHFDDESFAAGSARLNAKIDSIINNLDNCNKDEALKEMGRALHTLQDFYAHSNWVHHFGGINSGIYGMANPPGSLNCAPPTFAPGGVTSGYFSLAGFLAPTPFITQCASTPSNKCCHKDLNKDEPSRPLHAQARAAAEAATDEFSDRVASTIRSRFPGIKGESMVKLLQKDQRDMAFVIDDTGSMSTDIAGVKSTVNSLVDSIVGGNESPRFWLYSFKDSTTFRGKTCDPVQMKNLVAPLFASGGGDCPEAANGAMLAAAQGLSRNGQIFMATDASAGDGMLAPVLLAVTAIKNININVILTGNCTSDSLLSRSAEADGLQAAVEASVIPPGDLTALSSQRMFGALTALSGGLLFRVSRSEFAQAADVVLNRTRPGTADVLYAIDNATGSMKSYDVPIDSTMEDVTFVVSRLQATGTFTLTVLRPDGTPVAAGDPDATFKTISGLRTVTITAPADGAWKMQTTGTGRYVASVFGRSSLNLNRFSFLQAPVQQRPEVDNVPLPGLPVIGENAIGEARVGGGHTLVDFAFRNADATVIAPVVLAPSRDGVYEGPVTAPNSDFLVYATGVDANGQPFQRAFRQFFKAQPVKVVPKKLFQTTAPGTSLAWEFDVTNLGSTTTSYQTFIASSARYPVSGPSSITLAAGETKTVTLNLSVPASAVEGSEDLLSLVVISNSDPGVTNNAVVTTFVGSTNQAPDVSQAHASIEQLWPPNGKFTEVSVEGVTDADGDSVAITIDAIQQDEAVDATGDGSTCPDAGGTGTSTALLRAERSGSGDGRVYELRFTASDGRGGTSTGTVTVCVPQSQGKNEVCVDSGVRFDSTVCPTE
ncbi:MAG TPA: hypothetical protein VF618_00420 [Thermoanaerobaculia bacterium]